MRTLILIVLLSFWFTSCDANSGDVPSPPPNDASNTAALDGVDAEGTQSDTGAMGSNEVTEPPPEPEPEPAPEPEPGLEPGYISAKFVSASYTMGGSYGSFRHFTRLQYSFSDFDLCSCGGACNPTWESDCKELYYNPSTRQVKYLLEGEDTYEYRSLGDPYTCQKYEPLN